MKRTKNINHSSFRKSWSARHLTPVALAVTAVFMLAGCEKSDETVSLYQNADDCSAANPGKAAAEDMQYIVDMAQNAPFAMQALTDSFVKFRSAGLDPTDGSLKALVDSVARFGGDSELLKRAAVAVRGCTAAAGMESARND